jgi:hypothetical protein
MTAKGRDQRRMNVEHSPSKIVGHMQQTQETCQRDEIHVGTSQFRKDSATKITDTGKIARTYDLTIQSRRQENARRLCRFADWQSPAELPHSTDRCESDPEN